MIGQFKQTQFAAIAFHLTAADDLFGSVIAALDQNINSAQCPDQLPGRVFTERDDIIDTFQSGQNFHPFSQGKYRPLLPFQPPDRSVVIDPDHQDITLATGKLQQLDMAGVQ